MKLKDCEPGMMINFKNAHATHHNSIYIVDTPTYDAKIYCIPLSGGMPVPVRESAEIKLIDWSL